MSAAASTSAASAIDASRTLRLHVWGSSSTVPTLDPPSLYAASLLRAAFARKQDAKLQLASASTSLPRVPLLQVLDENHETFELLDNVEAIRAYCVAAGLDASFASDSELGAKQTALHALLDDQLLDLTLHSLFSLPANFRAVTAPAYSPSAASRRLRLQPARKASIAASAIPALDPVSIAKRRRNASHRHRAVGHRRQGSECQVGRGGRAGFEGGHRACAEEGVGSGGKGCGEGRV